MTTYFKWEYVTEVFIGTNPKEQPDLWRVVGSYDNAGEAVRHAEDPKEKRPTRVRQFKVSVLQEELPPPKDFAKSETNVSTLVPFFCPSCPGQSISATHTSSPRCANCKQTMFQGTRLQEPI